MKTKYIIIFCLLLTGKISLSQHILNFTIPSCPWVYIDDNNEISDIKIFPNPAQKILHIESKLFDNADYKDIEIFNMYNQKVYNAHIEKSETKTIRLNIEGLPAALYVLKITSKGKMYKTLFMIQ